MNSTAVTEAANAATEDEVLNCQPCESDALADQFAGGPGRGIRREPLRSVARVAPCVPEVVLPVHDLAESVLQHG